MSYTYNRQKKEVLMKDEKRRKERAKRHKDRDRLETKQGGK